MSYISRKMSIIVNFYPGILTPTLTFSSYFSKRFNFEVNKNKFGRASTLYHIFDMILVTTGYTNGILYIDVSSFEMH